MDGKHFLVYVLNPGNSVVNLIKPSTIVNYDASIAMTVNLAKVKLVKCI